MRVHFLLFLLLVILLPVQAGKHFWPDWAFVHGIRIDYLSPTLFLTDWLVALLLVFWLLEKRPKFKKAFKKSFWGNKVLLLIFLGFFLASSLLASRPWLALYQLLKLVELGFLAFYVAKNIISLRRFRLVVFCLDIAMLWSCFLAWLQFRLQSSVSAACFDSPRLYSFFQLLGERTFDVATSGIAKARWGSRLVLRPYASFPHPNALAGFITVVSLLVLVSSPFLVKGKTKKVVVGLLFSLAVSLAVLLITFSRSAWMVSFSAISYWLLIRKRREVGRFLKQRRGLGFFSVALVLVGVYLSSAVVLPWFQALKTDDSLSVFRRLELAKAAIRMTVSSPLWGIGLGNFVPRLFDFSLNREVVYWFQPVHNVFLLVMAETGLTGLGIFLWFLIANFKRLLRQPPAIKESLLIASVSILGLGLFDHYFLSLQSTRLLFSLVLGLSWARIKKDG